MNNNSTAALQDYIRYSRYAKYIAREERRETWVEQVQRVMNLHKTKYANELEKSSVLRNIFEELQVQYEKQIFLGSQRILQFAGDANDGVCPILKHQARVFNCVTTPLDRSDAFSEIMYLLLCGCGVGFSVQQKDILKLPNLHSLVAKSKTFVVPDTIEGWADAIGVLLSSYFREGKFPEYYGCRITFDFSLIRPKGAYITGGFRAPGPDGLEASLNKIQAVIERRISSADFLQGAFKNKLRTIDAYDIVMHSSDAVLSGGVRRSATIALFSKEDNLMLKAKTGNWFIENPQRGRSNNSVLLERNNTTKEEFDNIMNSVKEFGEPGYIWTDDLSTHFNPCVEIGMFPFLIEDAEIKSGVQGCNLTEINGRLCKTPEDFYLACKYAAIMGTLQAGYTDFKYLSPVSKKIFDKEALLGVSITGIMDNPNVLLNPDVLQKGAQIVKDTNAFVAEIIGINQAARTTCVKPAGSTSALLGTASGCHGHHSKRYIRHTQVNNTEVPGQIYKINNPNSVEDSVWSANKTDSVISFLVEASDNAILKTDLLNTKQLDIVKVLQQNWVEPGTNQELCVSPTVRHNVSNTVTVTDWDEVGAYIYENRNYLAGISFIGFSGDKDYPQAPFTEVLTYNEIIEKYGVAAMFASGLIVDGLEAFENKLWEAIDTAIKYSNPNYWAGYDLNDVNIYNRDLKISWCKRYAKFTKNYLNNDLTLCNYLLKDVFNLHKWEKISRTFTPIDWSKYKIKESFTEIDTMGAIACSGGACEII